MVVCLQLQLDSQIDKVCSYSYAVQEWHYPHDFGEVLAKSYRLIKMEFSLKITPHHWTLTFAASPASQILISVASRQGKYSLLSIGRRKWKSGKGTFKLAHINRWTANILFSFSGARFLVRKHIFACMCTSQALKWSMNMQTNVKLSHQCNVCRCTYTYSCAYLVPSE